MKNFFKRILTSVVAAATCFSMGLSTFAVEATTDTTVNDITEVTVGDAVMPRGTIWGHATKTITAADHKIVVDCTSSGGAWVGSGMGVTVKCTSSVNGGVIGYDAYPSNNSRGDSFSGYVNTNSEAYNQNLTQYEAKQYTFDFSVPDNVPSAYIEIWIYG